MVVVVFCVAFSLGLLVGVALFLLTARESMRR
jgi:hypothetical protein